MGLLSAVLAMQVSFHWESGALPLSRAALEAHIYFWSGLGEELIFRGYALVVLSFYLGPRAAVWALRDAGASEVLLWNRTGERAERLAQELGARAVTAPEPCDLLVNATSVGLDPGVADAAALAELGLDGVQPPRIVVDLVYRASGDPPPVTAWASRTGARIVDGIEVLVRQGALSFERWTGRPAPVEAMRAAARAQFAQHP